MLLFLSALLAAAAPGAHPAALVGTYNGGQMEMAAELKLDADGRFEYGLAYGALDEEAEGHWTADNGNVLLTSAPVKAPQFLLVSQQPGEPNSLQVKLDVPKGMDPQYFEAEVQFRDGSVQSEQLREDGGRSFPYLPGNPPVRMHVILPVFELAGDPVTIDPAKGFALSFRFEANDLGKAAFDKTPLRIDHGDLLLDRFDRHLRFRKVPGK